MAGCVADGDEQRHVATPGFSEGLVAALTPVERVVGVLEQGYGEVASASRFMTSSPPGVPPIS